MKFNIKTLGLTCLFMILLLSSMGFSSLTDDVIGYYTFDNDSTVGTLSLDKMGINNGTISGATVGVECLIKQCYSYDGTNNYLQTTDNTNSYDFSNKDFTISYWEKQITTTNGDAAISRDGTTLLDAYLLSFTDTGGSKNTLYVSTDGSGWLIAGGDMGAYSTTQWTHYIFKRNGTTLQVYRNTTLVFTQDTANSFPARTIGFVLARAQGISYWNGYIDEVGYWNRSLTSSEISQLYNSGTGISYPFTTNTIVINSLNITAKYPDGTSENDKGYWDVMNFTVSYIVYNSSNITVNISKNSINVANNTFYNANVLVGDNITYSIIAYNGTNNKTSSKTIQILPPSVNYLNLVNSSNLFKQNLLCNYSITHANNTIVEWFTNNTLIKNNSINFNITDHTNSILGNNLYCRLNNTVTSQSYTFYNYSNNIVVGQNITFSAKRNYDNFTINTFQICYSVGCYNTTVGNVTVWNYNVSDTYIFTSGLYQTLNITLTTNIGNQSYTFTPFDSKSITFNFYDSVTGILINNVSLKLYGNTLFNVYNYSTTTGSIYSNLTVRDTYTISATNPNYQTSIFLLDVSENSYQIKNVYLVNSTNKITYTVLENSNTLSDVTIKVLKYITNSWVYVQECTTTELGTCSLYLNTLNIYRYELYYNNQLTSSTGNELVDYTQRLFSISTGDIDFNEFNLFNYMKSSYVLTYNGINNTYNFSLSASIPDSEISKVCMRLYEENESIYQFDDCITYSNQAQIYVWNEILNNATYYIEIYANISGNNYILDKQPIDLSKDFSIFGTTGILLSFVLIFAFALFGIPSPSRIIVLGMTGLTLSSIMGFLPLSWVALSGLWIIVLLAVWKMGS